MMDSNDHASVARPVAYPSNLHAVRVREGLGKAELARLANLSERTIRKVEEGGQRVREETLRQIVNAINRNPGRVKRDEYEFEEVFPPNQAALF